MTRQVNGKHALMAAALLLGGSATVIGLAGPSPVDAPAEAGAARASVDSKLKLVKHVLAGSPAVHRVAQSGNDDARRKLDEAQALVAKAEADAAAERFAPAMKQLDEALRLIVAASRMVPDPAQVEARERARYAELRDAIRTFLNLHKSLSTRAQQGKTQTTGIALDVGRIDGLLDKAEANAAGGGYQAANAVLGDAYRLVVSALNRMMASETITYGMKFESPAEEFQYELARNGSYEGLVPLALAQLNVAPETAALAQGYVRQSRELRAAAQKQAAGGDYPAALKTIQEATGHLQRSLRVTGIVVPQTLDANR